MLVGQHGIWRRAIREHWGELALLFLLAALVTAAYEMLGWRWLSMPSTPLTIVGAAISVMLGFRSNEAYNRYNEARTLWGSLVNASRTLARQLLTLVRPGTPGDAEAFPREMLCRQIAYIHAVRCQLWRRSPFEDIAAFLPTDELERLRGERNVPTALLHTMGERLGHAWACGWIHDLHVTDVHSTLNDLNNAQGGCERIKGTPIPRSYTYFSHRIVLGYCCALPFGLVGSLGPAAPVAALLVSFTFLMLDRFAFLVEDPFCTTYTGLPLLAISRTVEVNLRQRLGEKGLPEDVQPVDGVLQ